ncbi:hypothetical protein BMR06_14890, partial [Methylococcaceae bacterium HT5]
TISQEKEAQILRYHHVEKWPVGTISRQLGIHHDAINRVLSQAGILKAERSQRASLIDDYLPRLKSGKRSLSGVMIFSPW